MVDDDWFLVDDNWFCKFSVFVIYCIYSSIFPFSIWKLLVLLYLFKEFNLGVPLKFSIIDESFAEGEPIFKFLIGTY